METAQSITCSSRAPSSNSGPKLTLCILVLMETEKQLGLLETTEFRNDPSRQAHSARQGPEPLSPLCSRKTINASHRGPNAPLSPKGHECQCRTFLRGPVSSQILRRAAGRWRVGWSPDLSWSEEQDLLVTSWDPYSINMWWFVWFIHSKIFFQTGNPWIMHWDAFWDIFSQ